MELSRKKIQPKRSAPNAPYILPWHYPNGARTHVNVRIDADWCNGHEWEQTMNILEPLGRHASWFITTGGISNEQLPLLDKLKNLGVEIGSHMHFHFTFRDEENNRHNMQLAHAWLEEHGISCKSFVSPSAKWNPGLQRCIDEMGYEYSSEFGLAHDCLPFSVGNGGLQVPVHPVCPNNFTTKEYLYDYYKAVTDALYRSCLPIHLYGHPHDIQYIGKHLVEEIVSLPDVHISSLLEFARWWKQRTCTYDLYRDEGQDRWNVEWSGSEGVTLAISWDGVRYAIVTAPKVAFLTHELPTGKIIDMHPYEMPMPSLIRKQLNWRSKVGQWLDLEYVVPLEQYRVTSLKTLVNYFLKILHG